MGTDISAFLAIDDNTPSDEPPFTNDPSCWDLRYDIGLSGGKHYEFYAAIAGVRNDNGKEPLIPPRGLPKYKMIAPVEDLCDDFGVGWLTLGEIEESLLNRGLDRNSLGKPVLLVLDTMRAVESLYGKDRVHLVFGFS
jgi:hypothetical protein